MRTIPFLLLVVTCLAHAETSPNPTPGGYDTPQEDRDDNYIETKVRILMHREDMTSIDALIADARGKKQTFNNGRPVLWAIYQAMDSSYYNFSDWDGMMRTIDSAAHRSPDSPVPLMARCSLLNSHAWHLRGNGYADSVNDAAANLFQQYETEENRMLVANKEKLDTQPWWYITYIENEGFLSGDMTAMTATLDEGIHKSPTSTPSIWSMPTSLNQSGMGRGMPSKNSPTRPRTPLAAARATSFMPGFTGISVATPTMGPSSPKPLHPGRGCDPALMH